MFKSGVFKIEAIKQPCYCQPKKNKLISENHFVIINDFLQLREWLEKKNTIKKLN